MAEPDLLSWPSVMDVVRATGLSPAWVGRLVREGRLVGVRTRWGWLVAPDALEAFVAERARLRAAWQEQQNTTQVTR
jgi:hypothetical protein